MPMNPRTEEEWEQYTPDASDSKKVRKKVPSGEHKDKEGNYGTFDVVAGRMRWTIHTYQLKEFKISARA